MAGKKTTAAVARQSTVTRQSAGTCRSAGTRQSTAATPGIEGDVSDQENVPVVAKRGRKQAGKVMNFVYIYIH